MKISRIIIGSALVVVIACYCLLRVAPARAAVDPNAAVPQIIQDGFKIWAKQERSSYAFDAWKKGGILEDTKKADTLAVYFASVERGLGKYGNYEVVDTKSVGQNSEIFYLTVKFERAAVYARFLVYHTDKDWVVQDMDFSMKPEALMPWLQFEGNNYTQ
jgi:hypothetical protein